VDDHVDRRVGKEWRGEEKAGESQNPNVGARLVRARDLSPAIEGVLNARPYKSPVRCGLGFIPDMIA
jgi:hypothetical protein